MLPVRDQHPALHYIASLYAYEDALMAEIRATFTRMNVAWQIGAAEGRLLQLLIKMHHIKTIVEVGTLGGYSALAMAKALPKDGHIYTLEKSPEHAELARGFIARSEFADRITVIEGDAHAELENLLVMNPDKTDSASLEKNQFDMIFIDAEKPGYPAYLDWADTGIRKGGLIVADNTFLFDAVWQETPPDGTAPATWNAMRQFNQRLADESRYFSTIIPTGDGLSVAVKIR